MKKWNDLVEVRKIIALTFTLLFVYMVVTKNVDAVVALSMINIVIGYYFGKSTALDTPGRKKTDANAE